MLLVSVQAPSILEVERQASPKPDAEEVGMLRATSKNLNTVPACLTWKSLSLAACFADVGPTGWHC